ncbi:type II toxin-antitoxin system VapC family toxin [soil metagenome]
MLLVDVNVLLYARRRESSQHDEYRGWLEDRLGGPEPVGISELVLSAFIRIVTNHRIYREPTTPEAAIEFCEAVLGAPAAVAVRPGSRHWPIFVELCRATRSRANEVPDAYLAALAIETGATWMTVDRGFARYPGVRWRHPLAESPR